MKILVACEESQAITKELRALGHDAYSCDLLPCSGGHPEWHFNYDVFQVIEENGGTLQNGNVINDGLVSNTFGSALKDSETFQRGEMAFLEVQDKIRRIEEEIEMQKEIDEGEENE